MAPSRKRSARVSRFEQRPPVPAHWDTETLDVLAGVVDDFPLGAIDRGRRYADNGRVLQLRYGRSEVTARVRGRRLYRTSWRDTPDGWIAECTCPVGPYCKHAVALASIVLLDGLPRDEIEDDWIASLLPGRLLQRRLAAAPRRTQRGHPAGAAAAESASAELTGTGAASPAPEPDGSGTPRPKGTPAPSSPGKPDGRDAPGPPAGVSRRAAAALSRLRSSPSWISRVQAIDELLGEASVPSHPGLERSLEALAEEGDPDLRCFMIAHAIAAHSNRTVPPALVPFLGRDDLRERLRQDVELDLAAGVASWVKAPVATRSLRLVLGLEHGAGSNVAVTLEARLTSRRLADSPRAGVELRNLLSQVQHQPDVLPTEQIELLSLLAEPVVSVVVRDHLRRFDVSGSALLRLAMALDGSPLVRWDAALPDDLASRTGLQPDSPLRLGAGPVTIGPAARVTPEGPRVDLECRLPDGRLLPREARLDIRAAPSRPHEPTLVLAEGALWTTRGDPPHPLPQMFAAAGGLDLAAARRDDLVEPLALAFPSFRASLAGHVAVHPVRPVVCLDLHEDDWLLVRAFAAGAPGWRPGEPLTDDTPLFEWTTTGRWPRCSSLPGIELEAGAALPGDDELPPAPSDDPPGDAAAPFPSESDRGREARGPGRGEAVDTWLELPDPERIRPVTDWLETLGAASGRIGLPGGRRPPAADAGVGGWLRLTASTIERFASAWDARPPGVDWYGNRAVRRLLSPAQTAPRLRIESSGIDWFTVSAAWEAERVALSDAELAKLRAARTPFVKLPSGWVRRDQVDAVDAVAGSLAELGIEAGGEPQRVSVWQLAGAPSEALASLEALAGDGAAAGLAAMRRRLAKFKGLRRVPVPRSVRAELRPYQREGLDFLVHTTKLGTGAVLADDMGLGKTLQCLAWIAWMRSRDRSGGPVLVVCPASVLHNWEREAARFTPSLRVLVLTAGKERRALYPTIPEHDLVLTTYALLRRDRDALAVPWRAVVLDEAQNIKNPDAAVSRAARSLEARHRLALTGTPLENRALDIWSLLAFVQPGYLGPRAAFVSRFDRADAPPHARRLLAAKLRPLVLRRLKGQVAPELPPRIEERIDCDLTGGQRKLYLAELAEGRATLDRLAAKGGLARHRISILAVLTRLRQVCCHPALVGGRPTLGSGKFTALFELLEPLLAEGHKVLVFSQFVTCLELVATALRRKRIGYHVLTGKSRRRGEIVAAFEQDPEPAVFLVSLKAGGTGLNLTAASYVVLFDPWWNPAVEAQAIDRTHRIGQDKTVIAYRMVARGTIEERIGELQQRKAALVADVLGEDGFARALTREDLDYLLADI